MELLMIQPSPEGQRNRKNYLVSLIAEHKVFMMPVNIFTALLYCTMLLTFHTDDSHALHISNPPAFMHCHAHLNCHSLTTLLGIPMHFV